MKPKKAPAEYSGPGAGVVEDVLACANAETAMSVSRAIVTAIRRCVILFCPF